MKKPNKPYKPRGIFASVAPPGQTPSASLISMRGDNPFRPAPYGNDLTRHPLPEAQMPPGWRPPPNRDEIERRLMELQQQQGGEPQLVAAIPGASTNPLPGGRMPMHSQQMEQGPQQLPDWLTANPVPEGWMPPGVNWNQPALPPKWQGPGMPPVPGEGWYDPQAHPIPLIHRRRNRRDIMT